MGKQARIVDFEEARSSSSRATSARGKTTRSASRQTSTTRASKKSTTTNKKAARGGKSAQTRRSSSAKKSEADKTRRENSSSRIEQVKRDRLKKKAERSFKRNVGQDAPAEEVSRPALYKTKMGVTHKKSAKMQARASSSAGFSFAHIKLGKKSSIALLVCACLVAGGLFLYTPAKNYYISTRDQAKAEIAYEIVSTRNAALAEDVALLSSDEGMEDRVRENYGWVKEGENAVMVAGLSEDDAPSAADILRTVTLDDIKAPETWYSPLLDSVFGYMG